MVALIAAACSDGETFFPPSNVPHGNGGSGGGPTGTGGTTAGTGGTTAGTGGTTAGTGGTTAGTGGTVGGTGGTTAGTGGTTAGTGGTVGGTGGTGGSSGELGYDPFGVGDPWFFDTAADLDAFEVAFLDGSNQPLSSGTATWEAPGVVHINTSFAQSGEKVHMHFTAPWDAVAGALAPMDLSGWVAKARVRVAEDSTASGGFQMFSQSTTSWTWIAGDWNNLGDLSAFTDVEFDFDGSGDPSQVMRFGFQIYGVAPGNVHLILDEIRLEPKDVGGNEPDAGGQGGSEQGQGGSEQGQGGSEQGQGGSEQSQGGSSSGEPDAGGGEEPMPDAGGGGEPIADAGAGGSGAEADSGAGGSGATGGTGGSEETGGTGGTSSGPAPLGLGDPWYFSTASEVSNPWQWAATNGTFTWEEPGQVRLSANLTDGTSTKFHYTTAWNGSANTPVDMTNRVVRARIRFEGTAQGHVQVFSHSGGWGNFTAGSGTSVSALGSFTDVELPMNNVPHPEAVIQIGLQLYVWTGGTANLIIDDLRIE